jgi:hypothetical protein
MRRHGWVTDLPSTAQIYTEDYPKETVRQPRALSEHVMAQLENPENLAKMSTPHHRLITLILIRCGLRISDTVTLTQDCITRFPSHLGHQTDHLDVPSGGRPPHPGPRLTPDDRPLHQTERPNHPAALGSRTESQRIRQRRRT